MMIQYSVSTCAWDDLTESYSSRPVITEQPMSYNLDLTSLFQIQKNVCHHICVTTLCFNMF